MRTLTKLLWILLLGVVFSCQDNVIDAIDATIDEKNFDTKMYETSVSVEDARNVAELFTVILEDFYNLLRHRRFGRKSKNEVMIWQPYLFLRFAVSCFHCHSS